MALRIVTGLKRSLPVINLQLEAGVPSLLHLFRTRQAVCLKKVQCQAFHHRTFQLLSSKCHRLASLSRTTFPHKSPFIIHSKWLCLEANKIGEGEGDERTVVHLRGIPWSATVEDIIKFFDGVEIKNGAEGVHLTLLRDGRPSGEAYVELESMEDATLAEQRHKHYMGARYVEVFRTFKSDMEEVLDRNTSSGMPDVDRSFVRLLGLSFDCSKEEIAQFFAGLEIIPNGITLPMRSNGLDRGTAFVQFLSEEIAEKAVLKDNETIGNRSINITLCDINDKKIRLRTKMRGFDDGFQAGNGRGRMGGGGGGGGGGMQESNFGQRNNFSNSTGHSVYMRGLPFSATDMDIVDFFSPLNLVNTNIIMNNRNRSTGNALVEFETEEDALKAMSKQKANMKNRYIDLFLQ